MLISASTLTFTKVSIKKLFQQFLKIYIALIKILE